jgi:hypothetical protein
VIYREPWRNNPTPRRRASFISAAKSFRSAATPAHAGERAPVFRFVGDFSAHCGISPAADFDPLRHDAAAPPRQWRLLLVLGREAGRTCATICTAVDGGALGTFFVMAVIGSGISDKLAGDDALAPLQYARDDHDRRLITIRFGFGRSSIRP